MSNYAVIITGAGSSTRYGNKNKLLELLGNTPVFIHSVQKLAGFASKENFILTVSEKDRHLFEHELEKYNLSGTITVVTGGSSRVESVSKAISAVKLTTGKVAIHDAARPLVKRELLEQLFASEHANIIAAQKVVDSIKSCDSSGRITAEVDRSCLWRAETPQVFDLEEYRKAMEKAPADATDDAMIMRNAGFEVYVFAESEENLKLTTSADLPKLAKFL